MMGYQEFVKATLSYAFYTWNTLVPVDDVAELADSPCTSREVHLFLYNSLWITIHHPLSQPTYSTHLT